MNLVDISNYMISQENERKKKTSIGRLMSY